jgi:hypothetical protein
MTPKDFYADAIGVNLKLFALPGTAPLFADAPFVGKLNHESKKNFF